MVKNGFKGKSKMLKICLYTRTISLTYNDSVTDRPWLNSSCAAIKQRGYEKCLGVGIYKGKER